MKEGNTQTQDGYDTGDGNAEKKHTHWRCNHILLSVYQFSFTFIF